MTTMNDSFYNLGEVRSLSKMVSDKIQEMILMGLFKPGERLVQTELAERFKVSRVAMRDALQDLRQTGLVIDTANGGVIVCPITERDLEDIAFVRNCLEPPIAIEASRKIGVSEIRILKEIIEKQVWLRNQNDYIAYLNADWEFHKTFYLYSGNRLAVDTIEKLWLKARQARGLVLNNEKWGTTWTEYSINSHTLMINAAESRDEEKLASLIHGNIQKAKKEQIEWLRQINLENERNNNNKGRFGDSAD